ASRPIRFRNGMVVNKEDLTLVECGADGRFSFPPQTERYLIVAIDEAGYAEVTDEELAASPEVTILAWGRVEGALRIGGQPVGNERVSLECYRPSEPDMPSVSPFYYSAGTDENGNFVLERLIPGVVKVAHEFYVRGKRVVRSHAELVEVGAGETVGVEIGGKGRAIVGRLALPADIDDSLDWANVWIWVALKLAEPPHPEDFEQMMMKERLEWEQAWRESEEGRAYTKMEWEEGRSYAVSMADDGTFRAEDVPAGTYQLQVSVSEAGLWWWGGSMPAAVVGYDGSLSYEFEVPDVSERSSDEPLDVGTFLLEVRKRLQVGDTAPAFEAETFDGQQIRLADYTGRVVVLTFWNSEDSSTAAELQDILEACSIFGEDTRLATIGMSLDRDVEAARKFATDNELRWINCFPAQGTRVSISEDYEIRKFPRTFVIGADGRILAEEPSPLLLESILAEALGM
ncbi:MAG: peroxiredoxin family protein, partial [Planctomycetota bacterium]